MQHPPLSDGAALKGIDSRPGAGDLIRPVSHSPLKGSAMIDKTTNVHWEGPGKKGKGQISIETATLALLVMPDMAAV